MADIGLELHDEVICACAAINLQRRNLDPRELLERVDDIAHLIDHAFKRSADQVLAVRATCQTNDRAARILVPERRGHAGEGGHEVDAVGVGRSGDGVLALLDDLQLVTQPLDRRAADEKDPFGGILHLSVDPAGNGRDTALARRDQLRACVHHQRGRRAIGAFRLPALEAGLPEQGALLVADGGGDRDLNAEQVRIRHSVDFGGVLDLR